MIREALAALKERGGSSRQAVLKYITTHHQLNQDTKVTNAHLKLALRAGVKNHALTQSKGTGAAGSFRLGDKKSDKPSKKTPKAKKVVAKPKTTGTVKKMAAKKAKIAKTVEEGKARKASSKKSTKPMDTKQPKAAKMMKPKVAGAKPKTAAKPKAAAKPKKPKSPTVKRAMKLKKASSSTK
jgi:hypothetical protein